MASTRIRIASFSFNLSDTRYEMTQCAGIPTLQHRPLSVRTSKIPDRPNIPEYRLKDERAKNLAGTPANRREATIVSGGLMIYNGAESYSSKILQYRRIYAEKRAKETSGER